MSSSEGSWPRRGFIVRSNLPDWKPRERSLAPIGAEIEVGLYNAHGGIVDDTEVNILWVDLGYDEGVQQWGIRFEAWRAGAVKLLPDVLSHLTPVGVECDVAWAAGRLMRVLPAMGPELANERDWAGRRHVRFEDFTSIEASGAWPGRAAMKASPEPTVPVMRFTRPRLVHDVPVEQSLPSNCGMLESPFGQGAMVRYFVGRTYDGYMQTAKGRALWSETRREVRYAHRSMPHVVVVHETKSGEYAIDLSDPMTAIAASLWVEHDLLAHRVPKHIPGLIYDALLVAARRVRESGFPPTREAIDAMLERLYSLEFTYVRQ